MLARRRREKMTFYATFIENIFNFLQIFFSIWVKRFSKSAQFWRKNTGPHVHAAVEVPVPHVADSENDLVFWVNCYHARKDARLNFLWLKIRSWDTTAAVGARVSVFSF